MTVKFKIGSVYKIQQSMDEWMYTYMYLDDETQVDFNTTVFLCLRKNQSPSYPDTESFFFLCTDKHGIPHEFIMSEGSVYGDLCVEIK